MAIAFFRFQQPTSLTDTSVALFSPQVLIQRCQEPTSKINNIFLIRRCQELRALTGLEFSSNLNLLQTWQRASLRSTCQRLKKMGQKHFPKVFQFTNRKFKPILPELTFVELFTETFVHNKLILIIITMSILFVQSF